MKRGLSSWLSVAVLVILVAAAAVGSALAAPSHPSRVGGTVASTSQTTEPTINSSCEAPTDAASIVLSYVSPAPTVTIPAGSLLVVEVPPWHFGDAADVQISNPKDLTENCSTLLPDHGRLAVMKAASPGKTTLSATITPATDAFMPAWIGYVVVTTAPDDQNSS